MKSFLSKKQRKELLNKLKSERRTRYSDRVRVILLLDQGETYKDITKFLFLSEVTISSYRNRYKDGGLDLLLSDDRQGKQTKLSEEQKKILTKELESKIYPDTKSVIHFVKKTFGVEYKRSGMTNLLHSLGFTFKKPKMIPGKAERFLQEEFIKQYNSIKWRSAVYFADAAHPTYNNIPGYGWIKKGSDKEIKTNSGRQRVNVLGAVEMGTNRLVARTFKTIDSIAMCSFLRAIRTSHPSEEEEIYLIVDNASYNKSEKVRKLAKDLNIKLRYLPPYSTNLNPIERLWKHIKKRVMANTYYESFPDFKDAISKFFRYQRKHLPDLQTLITENFHLIGST